MVKTFNPKSIVDNSFKKTLLDAPIRLKRKRVPGKVGIFFEKLPAPLVPVKYQPPKPEAKPRSQRPVPLPRLRRQVQLRDPQVQKFIRDIKPLYRPEAIREFRERITDPAKVAQKKAFREELASKLRKRILLKLRERKNGLRGVVQSFELEYLSSNDPRVLFDTARNSFIKKLSEILHKKGPHKGYFTIRVEFKKRILQDGEEAYEFTKAYFNSTTRIILNELDIRDFYDKAVEEIINRIARWISKGSGWVIERIINFYLNIVSYVPLKGRSYFPLPGELRNSKRGLINLQNDDNECFRWCHVRHINPDKKDPQRITQKDRKIAQTLDYTGVTFPVTIKDIGRIEKQNKININAYLYNEDGKYVTPYRNSETEYGDTLNVLLIERETEAEYKQHYVYIKDFNRLNFNINRHEHKKYFCQRCIQPFTSEARLEAHKGDCLIINGTQRIEMPQPGSKVFFHNYQNQLPAPFTIYADFEALTRKIDSCSPRGDKSYTQAYQKHEACGFGYKVVCHYDQKYSKPAVIYRGENVIKKFYHNLTEEVKYCQKIITEKAKRRLVMTKKDEEDFQKAKKCWICEKKYKPDEKENIPVRDHCHMTGKYRGSAHKTCNFRLQISAERIKIPVIFHNLKGYDGHFIIGGMGDIIKEKKEREEEPLNINVIASNAEKYITFKIGKHLKFIDSYQFMASPLANLAKTLPAEKYIYTSEAFSGEKLELMKAKGVYPYDYMDSFQKFSQTQLPKREDFYSLLTDEEISEEEYAHAGKVWETFGIENMGQYHDLYLKSDVLLLADIFENFREQYLDTYGLDPAHYVSLPSSSWDAMQKMTDVRLDLLTDVDMLYFIEKGTRGGISTITHRYAHANNKYMKNYDSQKESSHIIYLDANNLYGWAMIQKLPTGDFRWIKSPEYINLDSYDENSSKGLILEVSLEYPKELHSLHNDYPLAPEKITVGEEMLSDYCQMIKSNEGIKTGQMGKLIPNLRDKEKYVLHYRNLQLYLSLGLKLKKIHRALQFSQSNFLAKYINFNTQKRAKAKNAFEKDFFKLANNAVFGKTMENKRKRCNIQLVADPERMLRLAARPTYVSHKIFHENLVAVHYRQPKLVMDKPCYLGMCILDLSKTIMYDFHYNYIKKKYPDAKLLFTDTDSLCYHIRTEDIYSDFIADRERFDNSDYPSDSKFYFSENKKVIGKFKDETAGVPIREFIGLKSKMYSISLDNEKNSKKAKGVKKNVVRKGISHGDYLQILKGSKVMHHKMKTIRSDCHQISSYEINKISLSPFDDKRYILSDGISSYAYGHLNIIRDKD